MHLPNKAPLGPIWLGFQILAVVAFISFKYLFADNMGMVNEVDVLPLARQAVDPGWIPGDWYLNQPPGYRRLFALLFGSLAASWGFLAASILGRLVCYGLVAAGLVLIGRRLELRLSLLLTAIGLFLYVNPEQGMVAQEWLVRSLEAKAVAYGLLLLALFYLLRQSYRPMAMLLGLATSFHVLVGGWAMLIVAGKLLLDRLPQRLGLGRFCGLGLIYLVFSSFAIPPVWAQLFSEPITSDLSPSFIYVFLRLPHHLNPLSWSAFWWLPVGLYLAVLIGSMAFLRRQQESVAQYQAALDLFQITLLSLVPFVGGLLVAPFDSQGRWLQFYPFRVGDVLLPLNSCLLLACAVQQGLSAWPRTLERVCLGLIAITCCIQAVTFQVQLAKLRQFPANQDPALDPELFVLADWVKTQTPPDALVVTSPVEFVEFSWLTERPTIAKYKLLPQSKAKIVEWYKRLADLNGGAFPQTESPRTQDSRSSIRRSLIEGYDRLTTQQVQDLMTKYSAPYFMTRSEHRLDLPVAYRNGSYMIYGSAAR